MEITDLDHDLWKCIDRPPYKNQSRDAQRCIEDGANVNCQRPMDIYGDDLSKLETPLLVAICRCAPKLVKRLIELGADSSAEIDAFGERTLLHIAALHDRAETVGILIKAGVSMEKKDTIFGWTALHLAVFKCHRHHLTVRMLLMNGANVNAMDNSGRKPLDIALEYEGRFSPQLKEILSGGEELSDKTVTPLPPC
jgi:hypothetical protein